MTCLVYLISLCLRLKYVFIVSSQMWRLVYTIMTRYSTNIRHGTFAYGVDFENVPGRYFEQMLIYGCLLLGSQFNGVE